MLEPSYIAAMVHLQNVSLTHLVLCNFMTFVFVCFFLGTFIGRTFSVLRICLGSYNISL